MAFLAVMVAAAVASPDVSTLDGDALVASVREQTQKGAPAALEHQRFRLVLPVRWAKARKVPTFKSPAVWRYDGRSGMLEVAIGFGQMSPENYDKFEAQGLSALPPLQTAFFSVAESGGKANASVPDSEGATGIDGTQSFDLVTKSRTWSYGLATPLGKSGEIDGMPKDFKPLMVYRAKIDSRKVREVVNNLKLEIEGEVTSFGPAGSVVCGRYEGGVLAHEMATSTRIMMDDRQCFVAARIERVAVMGKGGYYLRWEKPEEAAPGT